MTKEYNLMTYFAHSILTTYSKDIQSHLEMSTEEFINTNKEVIKRVKEESLIVMNYNISNNQIRKAAFMFIQAKHNPISVKETSV